ISLRRGPAVAIIRPVPKSRVPLPSGVTEPYTVYLNGVRQAPGPHFQVRAGAVEFDLELAKEGKLGFWRWFLGAWGIGTYRKNDQVDVAWEVGGAPRGAHALAIDPPPAPR